MSTIQEGLFYTEDHEWVRLKGNTVSIGITDFAQSSLGDIVFVELPEDGSDVSAGDSFGVVESIKSVSDLYSPVSGKVLEKNTPVEETPELINQQPFDAWLIKVEVQNTDEVTKLMDSQAYSDFCNQ